MSKESSHLLYPGKTFYGTFNTENAPDSLVRRPGKTKRDRDSGATANHLANRAAKADENRGKKK